MKKKKKSKGTPSPKKKSKLEEKFGEALIFKMPDFKPPTLDNNDEQAGSMAVKELQNLKLKFSNTTPNKFQTPSPLKKSNKFEGD